uniref:Uncharacterized protein n=1 Tax=Molossus molossus TaxID=27622 RepID=A0A7J8FZ65_MOLMO|nr:hypothetical protein HJG59_008288 [Molossus molossus]
MLYEHHVSKIVSASRILSPRRSFINQTLRNDIIETSEVTTCAAPETCTTVFQKNSSKQSSHQQWVLMVGTSAVMAQYMSLRPCLQLEEKRRWSCHPHGPTAVTVLWRHHQLRAQLWRSTRTLETLTQGTKPTAD